MQEGGWKWVGDLGALDESGRGGWRGSERGAGTVYLLPAEGDDRAGRAGEGEGRGWGCETEGAGGGEDRDGAEECEHDGGEGADGERGEEGVAAVACDEWGIAECSDDAAEASCGWTCRDVLGGFGFGHGDEEPGAVASAAARSVCDNLFGLAGWAADSDAGESEQVQYPVFSASSCRGSCYSSSDAGERDFWIRTATSRAGHGKSSFACSGCQEGRVKGKGGAAGSGKCVVDCVGAGFGACWEDRSLCAGDVDAFCTGQRTFVCSLKGTETDVDGCGFDGGTFSSFDDEAGFVDGIDGADAYQTEDCVGDKSVASDETFCCEYLEGTQFLCCTRALGDGFLSYCSISTFIPNQTQRHLLVRRHFGLSIWSAQRRARRRGSPRP